MKNKKIAAVVAAGTIVILALGGTLAVNNVFAAEEMISITSENSGTVLQSYEDTEILQVYKTQVYKDTGCNVILPAGYKVNDTIKGMYISERYPLDSSNIYYTVSEGIDADALNQMMTTDEHKKYMEKIFKESYGAEASINSYSSEKISIDGCLAYKIKLSCKWQNMEMNQLIYLIAADRTYSITYSQASDDERMEDFEKSAQSIHLVFG